jgi:uncharacterized protein (TIGR04255 family)
MTVTNSLPLPDFETPPVDEVVCGVLFEPLVGFLLPHFGLLWEKFKPEYLRCQEVSPLLPVVEGPEQTSIQEIVVSEMPLPRIWFLHSDGRIIQVQRDRFLHNWRKLRPTNEYPRYHTVFQMFQDHLLTFQRFLNENQLGPLMPRQYEMTYVNVIQEGEGWQTIEEVNKVFPDFSWGLKKDRFLPSPIGINWRTTFPLPHEAGRLHLDVQNARRTDDNRRLFRFEVTARGIFKSVSPDAMRDWFDLAHEWIVRGFTDYTGYEIQKAIWGLKK